MSDPVLISVRLLLFGGLMLVVGIAAFALYALDNHERRNPEITASLWAAQRWLCGLNVLMSTVGMAILSANMFGVGLFELDLAVFRTMVLETDVGSAWLYRTASLALALAASFALAKRPEGAATTLVATGSIALASLVWSGHAGATEGISGLVHKASDAAHMIAAAVWLGALATFLVLLRPPSAGAGHDRLKLAARSLDQFARIGTACVAIIIVTGLINSQLLIGASNIGRSLAAPYGQLLAAKLLLFGLMLALAAANRWRLTPTLQASLVDPDANSVTAIGAMRKSLFIEAAAAATILALVAWLGTLEPLPIDRLI